jgi:hypothetical protein
VSQAFREPICLTTVWAELRIMIAKKMVVNVQAFLPIDLLPRTVSCSDVQHDTSVRITAAWTRKNRRFR